MNIIERAEYAMSHYMINNPEKTKAGMRPHFINVPFPRPHSVHAQWDDGDTTSRALDAWIFLRRITGNNTIGAEVEAGQWEYFKSFIHPETGMAFVRDHSKPNRDGYYYHMWDNGRALTHLVNRYQYKNLTEEEKASVARMIEKMIAGCVSLSSTTVLNNGLTGRYWQTDTFFNLAPVAQDMDFGTFNFVGFTVVSAVLLQPIVKWAEITEDVQYERLALELAEGFLAGLEKRRENMSPAIAPNGAFYGHVHCNITGLVGLVELGKLLIKKGEPKGKEYIEKAGTAYGWVFSKKNLNPASSCGWIPENFGTELSPTSETCCTADMITLAKSLAELSDMDVQYAAFDRMWDDVDRFTINQLFNMQILNTDRLRKYAVPDVEAFDRIKKHFDGGWVSGQTYPHDIVQMHSSNPITGVTCEEFEGKRIGSDAGGCCLMSGPRGMAVYWDAMVKENAECVNVRFPGVYKSKRLEMQPLENGGLEIVSLLDCQIRIRLPRTAKEKTVKVLADNAVIEYAAEGNRILIQAKKNIRYRIEWDNRFWCVQEHLGKLNNGHVKGVECEERIEYTLIYYGNKLVSLEPDENAFVPQLY